MNRAEDYVDPRIFRHQVAPFVNPYMQRRSISEQAHIPEQDLRLAYSRISSSPKYEYPDYRNNEVTTRRVYDQEIDRQRLLSRPEYKKPVVIREDASRAQTDHFGPPRQVYLGRDSVPSPVLGPQEYGRQYQGHYPVKGAPSLRPLGSIRQVPNDSRGYKPMPQFHPYYGEKEVYGSAGKQYMYISPNKGMMKARGVFEEGNLPEKNIIDEELDDPVNEPKEENTGDTNSGKDVKTPRVVLPAKFPLLGPLEIPGEVEGDEEAVKA